MAAHADAEDSAGRLPYLGTPREPWKPLVVNGITLPDSMYFQQSRYYVNLLYPDYYTDRKSLDRPIPYGLPVPERVIVSRYDITNCAFAASKYWAKGDTPDDLSLYHGMRLADVAWPAQKGMLLDLATGVIAPSSPRPFPGRITVGLADGSAGQRTFDESSNERTVTRPYGSVPWPVMATLDGFQGRDFE